MRNLAVKAWEDKAVAVGADMAAAAAGGQGDVGVVGLGDAAAAGDESGSFQGVFGGVGEAWCDTHTVNNS